MATDPASITSEDASYLKSREARATGQGQPPKDSISAEAQRLASANEQGIARGTSQGTASTSSSDLTPEEQSLLTKESNFQVAASEVTQKMASQPEDVTKEDGDLLHSREQRARGRTEKQGIAAQAQSLASENQAKGTA